MKRLLAVAAASSLALGALGVATLASPAGAAGETVSITVELDYQFQAFTCTDGPVVFVVTDVPIGVGPELTGDPSEITSNPCGWGGSLSVDVEPETKQVTVATADSDLFQTAVVTVTYPGIGSVTTTSDDLWVDGSEGCSMAAPVIGILGNGFSAGWTVQADCLPNGYAALNDPGAAVFTWADAIPTTTTTAAPPAAVAAAAAATTVTPAFTG